MTRIAELLSRLRLRRPRALTLAWEERAQMLTMNWTVPEPRPPAPEPGRTEEDAGNVVPFRHRPTRPPPRPDRDPGPGDAA
jgi:hypothetical protein